MSILIKKYKNRRLYDTEKKQFITLENLRHYVIQKKSFRVEEAQTQKDITNSLLLQILIEVENTTHPFLSSDILKQLIIASNHPMHQSFKTTLEQLLSLWEKPLKETVLLKEYQQLTDFWEQKWQDFWNNSFKK